MSKTNQKFKSSPLGPIPGDWKVFSFEKIARLIKDACLPAQSKADLPYIGLEHIEQQALSLNSIGGAKDVTSNKFQFQSGDVLFGKLRPYFRKVYRPSFSGVCSTDIWVIRANHGTDQGFIFYFVANEDFIDLATSGSSGTRMPRADWNHLKDVEWSIPPFPEQHRIAEILSSLDDKIELNRKMNKTLESIAQAVFKRWFVDENKGKVVAIDNFVEFDSQIAIKKGEMLPFVDMKSLSTENMSVSGITIKAFSGGARFQNNDTLLARITPCLENGKIAFVNFLEEDCPVGFGSTEFIVMRPKKGISPQFVYCLARYPNFRSHAIKSMIGSSGRQRVQINMLKTYEIANLDQRIMDKFDQITLSLFDTIKKNAKEIQTLSQIRDLLLPRLMSGRVRV